MAAEAAAKIVFRFLGRFLIPFETILQPLRAFDPLAIRHPSPIPAWVAPLLEASLSQNHLRRSREKPFQNLSAIRPHLTGLNHPYSFRSPTLTLLVTQRNISHDSIPPPRITPSITTQDKAAAQIPLLDIARKPIAADTQQKNHPTWAVLYIKS